MLCHLAAGTEALCIMLCWTLTQWQHADVQMQFQSRKADLGLFKERAGALEQAVVILEEGIAASRAQVTPHLLFFSMIVRTMVNLPLLDSSVSGLYELIHEIYQDIYQDCIS